MFSVELTGAEMAGVRARVGSVGGLAAGSERTYLEVVRVGELVAAGGRDNFSMLGMVVRVLGG